MSPICSGFRRVIPLRTLVVVAVVPRARRSGGDGARPASVWRCGGGLRDRGALALQDFAAGLLSADPAVRHFDHRPGADGVGDVAVAARSTASWRSSTLSP